MPPLVKQRRLAQIRSAALRLGVATLLSVELMATFMGARRHCRAAEGRTIVVAQRHPAAADNNQGSADKPFKTISRAAQEARPGDQVLIEDGVYREAVVVETSGTKEHPILFAAAPGANVVVTGADVVADWRKEPGAGALVSAPWPHVFAAWSPNHAHPDDNAHQLIGRCEQVVVDGYPLMQVASLQELTRGAFFVDLKGQRLYLWDRMNRDPVE